MEILNGKVIKELFSFRNTIAHAKSVKIKSIETLPIDKYDEVLSNKNLIVRTKWEKYCTKENAEKARKDVENIIQILHKAGKFGDSLFFSGLQVYSGTVRE